ncbi:MAG: 16S rRNA (adenine(1518)-N(6)/adenine(1519)-N(6))-dimethyltransferase RsmA [Candidatus Lokiarchaeota archaeon]|nr:16S rRNA (adenine(1518)-N(6)/adenine(1519)-N(6))-dimethyltransferase RsmA [Candidatus Lokiarchaeota archaeon]
MNLTETRLILNTIGVIPKKSLGQNFLIDRNVLNKMINEAEISQEEIILEIGAGLGALTTELEKKAKKVYAYEIDKILYQYLKDKFSTSTNVEIINADALKSNIPPHDKIVSNIPYTITGPILENFFYKENSPVGIMIIENSLSKRILDPKKYKNFSRIGVTFNAFMDLINKYQISRNCFYPIPSIDLALIKIKPKTTLKPFLKEPIKRKLFIEFIAGITPYKNKTLSNSLKLYLKNNTSLALTKSDIIKFIKSNSISDEKVFHKEIDELIATCELLFEYTN